MSRELIKTDPANVMGLLMCRFILSNQTVVACVQATLKARRPPYRAHGNVNASPRLPGKYHGAGRSPHKDHRGYKALSR